MGLRWGTYIGPVKRLQGQDALLMPLPDGQVRARFDDKVRAKWGDFERSDFELDETDDDLEGW